MVRGEIIYGLRERERERERERLCKGDEYTEEFPHWLARESTHAPSVESLTCDPSEVEALFNCTTPTHTDSALWSIFCDILQYVFIARWDVWQTNRIVQWLHELWLGYFYANVVDLCVIVHC